MGQIFKYGICGESRPGTGCGARIIWAQDAKGVKIPLDPRAAVYMVQAKDGLLIATRQAAPDLDAMAPTGMAVGHFHTCPKASDFTRTKKGSA